MVGGEFIFKPSPSCLFFWTIKNIHMLTLKLVWRWCSGLRPSVGFEFNSEMSLWPTHQFYKELLFASTNFPISIKNQICLSWRSKKLILVFVFGAQLKPNWYIGFGKSVSFNSSMFRVFLVGLKIWCMHTSLLIGLSGRAGRMVEVT